jgi:hypothetical protein
VNRKKHMQFKAGKLQIKLLEAAILANGINRISPRPQRLKGIYLCNGETNISMI